MNGRDCEQLTLFPAGSRVSRSLSPGSEEARKMTVSSGLRCAEWLSNSDPLGYLARMCLGSSVWHSTRCYLTWKTSVTPRKRLLFQLAVSMPRTSANGSPFWPTPSTGAALCAGTGNFETPRKMAEKGMITEEERRQLSRGNGGKTNPELLEWLMGYSKAFTQLIPTPTARCYNGAPAARYITGGGYRANLNELLESTPRGIIGRTNPGYLEHLMGYRTGWTESDVSETRSCRSSSISSSS